MKIVRLELFGFKSFKDKTLITFNQPITAIVGSNGCGKSNVVDALYWVMGDMSPKHLRGSVMTDVIFSGSKDSAPMDVAEVTLVLERNPTVDPELPPQFQASTEIQITRRYYRSGDSEYLINKIPCRLRDIQEFFMDTGVGAKAYSIVEQGAISRMISLKPEDRRVVIEEVAGIMKFKARKAETERKIESTQTNLQRLDDIVQDLQKQLSSLKRQAERAEKFKDLSRQLKDLELRVASREWIERGNSRKSAQEKIENLRDQLSQLESGLGTEKSRLEQSQNLLNDLEENLSQKRDQTRRLELALKDTENELRSLETRKENFEHRISSNQAQLEEISSRGVTLATELLGFDEKISELETRLGEVTQSLEGEESGLEALGQSLESLDAALTSAKKEIHQEDIAQTKIAQEIQTLQRQISQIENKKVQLSDQIQILQGEMDLLGAERTTTMASLEQAFATRKELESAKLGVDERLSTLEKEKLERLQARENCRQNLAIVGVKREQIEALERNLEGVEAAAKAIALHFRSEGGQGRLLADQISVPASLEKAIEAALGSDLQRIVATDASEIQSLQTALENSSEPGARTSRIPVWLDRGEADLGIPRVNLDQIYLASSSGPDSFSEIPGPDGLVSTAVEAQKTAVNPLRTLKTFLLDHPGVIGPVVAALEDAGISARWTQLLRNFWIVRDRKTLLEITSEIKDLPVGLVSLEGDCFHPNGFLDLCPIEQDSSEAASGLIQRRRIAGELRDEEGRLKIDLEQAESQLDFCLQNISAAKEEFRTLTHRLAALDPDVNRHTSFLREVETKIARISEKERLLREDLETSTNLAQEIGLKLETLGLELAVTEETRKGLAAQLESLVADRDVLVRQRQEKVDHVSEIRNQIRGVEKELAGFQSQRAALKQEASLQETRKEQLESENSRLSVQISEFDSEIENQIQALRIQKDQATVASQEESELLDQVQSSKAGLRGLQAEVERLTSDLNQIQHQVKDLDQEVAIHSVELKNVSERIESAYQISLATLDENQVLEMSQGGDLEELADNEAGKRLAQQLRNKIDNLGKINMVAVEEFEDVRRRHEYLFIQREDLGQALAQLRDAITRIDRESRDRFGEAFVAVNAAFQKTFPLLFGGGNAELRLTQPDNLLETGVEIVAQPPGKKLQSVTLLSGGEKALTAVSLIFGIFSIKPSPFCVLDEVDAPLDDANVGRFNNLVRQITDRSQVIMITHHKKTMESADALFGVTMEKPGISKLASVRIGELKDN